jgi:hypothetical protein
MVKMEFPFCFIFKMNTNEDICINDFFYFFNSTHGLKLTRFLLCIALGMGNSDQLKFIS